MPEDAPIHRRETQAHPGSVRVVSGQAIHIEGYELIRELHRGGQGVVYEALQRSAKRKVAIKVMLAGSLSSKPARKRFEREIELVAQLKHPNIIPVFHSGETDQGVPFFVMEYVRGTRLDQYVQEKKLPLEDVLSLFVQVCEAVQYAHQRGVIHRDLKPSNVIVDSDGTPRVLDFGLAKLLAGPIETIVSVSAEILGTIPYMSPEQVRGNPDEIDTRSDVYALGVVLYELLTGRLPYPSSAQMAELIRHIAETPPSPPSAVWNAKLGGVDRTKKRARSGGCPIDDEVETIVLRALAKDRTRRYQSAGELGRDLGHYLAGEAIEARRDSGWYILRTALRRYRFQAAGACAAILALAVVATTATILYRRASLAEIGESKQRALAEGRAVELEQERELARKSEREAMSLAYLASMQAAAAALAGGDGLTAAARLSAAPSALRNWEWYYLHQQVDTSSQAMRLADLLGHNWSSKMSPDGRWVLVVQADVPVRLFDTTGDRPQIELQQVGELFAMSWSPNSRYFVLHDGVYASIFDVQNLTAPITIDASLPQVQSEPDSIGWDSKATVPQDVAISSDAQLLAAAFVRGPRIDIHTAGIWDVSAETLIESWASDADLVLFDDTEPTAYFGLTRGHVAVVDARNPSNRYSIAIGEPFEAFCVSPEGGRLAAGDSSGTVRLFDLTQEPPTVVATYREHGESIRSLVFDTNGKRLASSANDRTLFVHSLESGSGERMLGQTSPATSIAFRGDSVVTVATDGTVKTWETPISAPVFSILRSDRVTVDWPIISEGGQLCAMPTPISHIEVWDLASRSLRCEIDGHGNNLVDYAFSPDGRWLASSSVNSDVAVWDALTCERLFRHGLPEVSPGTSYARSLQLSPDGQFLFASVVSQSVGDAKPSTCVWNAAKGIQVLGPIDEFGFGLSDDGTIAITISFDPYVLHTWSVENAKSLAAVELKRQTRVAVIKDGLALFDPESEHHRVLRFDGEEHCVLNGIKDKVSVTAWRGANNQLAAAYTSGELRAWDVETCTQVMQASLPTVATSVALSPDATRIAIGFRDGSLRVYGCNFDSELLVLPVGKEPVYQIAFSSDSSAITAVSADGTVKRWATERQ